MLIGGHQGLPRRLCGRSAAAARVEAALAVPRKTCCSRTPCASATSGGMQPPARHVWVLAVGDEENLCLVVFPVRDPNRIIGLLFAYLLLETALNHSLFLCGADEVQQLHESRQLWRLLEGPATRGLPARRQPPAAMQACGLLLVIFGSWLLETRKNLPLVDFPVCDPKRIIGLLFGYMLSETTLNHSLFLCVTPIFPHHL